MTPALTDALHRLETSTETSVECVVWSDPSAGATLSLADVRMLCTALRFHGRVQTLSLSGHAIDSGATSELAMFLGTCTSLKMLDVSFCSLSAAFLDHIVDAVAGNASIAGALINASHNSLNTMGAHRLADTISTAPRSGGLRHLVLRHNPIGSEGAATLIDRCGHLESLDLSHCNVVWPSAVLQRALQKTKLAVLRLGGIDAKASHPAAEEIVGAACSGCTVHLDDSTDVRMYVGRSGSSSRQGSPGLCREVEEQLWREELALLHSSRQAKQSPSPPDNSGFSHSPSPTYGKSGICVSPIASSPPPAAASPLILVGRSSHSSSGPSYESSTSPRGHHQVPRRLPPDYLWQHHHESAFKTVSDDPSVPAVVAKPSKCEWSTASEDSQTVRSLSIAINVLHDSLAAVTVDRDRLRDELRHEVQRRRGAEAELLEARKEIAALQKKTRGQTAYDQGTASPRGTRRDLSPQPRSRSSRTMRKTPGHDEGGAAMKSGCSSPRVTARRSTHRNPLTEMGCNALLDKSPSKRSTTPSKSRPGNAKAMKSPGDKKGPSSPMCQVSTVPRLGRRRHQA